MNKRIILVLSTITIVIGSSYFITGKFIQKNYYTVISKIAKRSDIKVSLISYDRGFFHSKAKIALELPSSTPDKRETFVLMQHIAHGPIVVVTTPNGLRIKIIASKISTQLEDELHQQMVKYTGNAQPVKLTTTVDFNDQATTWLKISGIDPTSSNTSSISWSTIVGEIKHDLKLSNYQGAISFPRISINSPEWVLSLSDVAVKINSDSSNSIYSNTNNLSAKNLVFTRNNEERLNMADIAMNLDLGIDQAQKFGINFALHIASSKIQQQQFADDMFTLQLNNIQANNVPSLALFEELSPRSMLTLLQQLTKDVNSNLEIKLPKQFTESLLTYVSYELYRNSVLGKIDQRSEDVIMRDITNSINGLVQGAINQKLFIDQGTFYALNFNKNSVQKS